VDVEGDGDVEVDAAVVGPGCESTCSAYLHDAVAVKVHDDDHDDVNEYTDGDESNNRASCS